MAVPGFAARDLLRSRLKYALETLARCDIRGPQSGAPQSRSDALMQIRTIEEEARASGIDVAELYAESALEIEDLADRQAECSAEHDEDDWR